MKFMIINGPNLNLLGIREPEIYGNKTYADLIEMIGLHCEKRGITPEFYQSNHEGDIIDKIHEAYFSHFDAVVINPGGYTHTSVAIGDALKGVNLPAAEVHISDINGREDYRKISFVRDACVCTVSGKGFEGYNEAIDKLIDYIEENR